MRRLPDSTGLHIFVVTLRCEHTCRYCQVSRQSAAKSKFDMTEQTARRALELAFRSPSPQLKIEFQGGEPLLNFPLVPVDHGRGQPDESGARQGSDVRDRDEPGAA